jgi:hypothetical protein
VRGSLAIDHLLVIADDLDAPTPLPSAASLLSITEPGPVGIFASSLTSVQQIQSLLRAGDPIPPGTNVGLVAEDATLTTSITIAQIQALLASTPEAYDIIPIIPPPGSYDAAVDGAFASRNAVPGTTVYDGAASGAMLQGGVDSLTGGEDLDAFYFYQYQAALNLLVPQVSNGGAGRLKLAEGGTVLPQDRVYLRYNYIDDVAYRTNGVGVSRFTPGIEHTMGSGLFSLEVRAPFASTTVLDVTTDGAQTLGSEKAEFGNLVIYLKGLLYQSRANAISTGLGVELPTASDARLAYAGAPLFEFANEDVHLQPFLGMMHYWNEHLFCQGFVQFDIAVGDNEVRANLGNGLTPIGAFSDRDHLFVDYGIGYWLHRNQKSRGLTGVIPTLEFHHTSSMSDGEMLSAGPFVFETSRSTSVTNYVAGTTLEFGRNKHLAVAYVGELGSNEVADGAFRLFLSHQR